MYGNRFTDMWRDINWSDVKKCWSDELRLFSVDQVGMAIDGLKHSTFPPTLPEFLQLCEQARKDKPRIEQSALPILNDPPETIEAAKARCFETARNLGMLRELQQATSNAV